MAPAPATRISVEVSASLIAKELLRLGLNVEFTKEEAYAAVKGLVPPDTEAAALELARTAYREIMWTQCQRALAIDNLLDVMGWSHFFDRCTEALTTPQPRPMRQEERPPADPITTRRDRYARTQRDSQPRSPLPPKFDPSDLDGWLK